MAYADPAWQTGELGEEWVEPSPSPPQTVSALPTDSLPQASTNSIRQKRGSLRSLGHAQDRELPLSRSNSIGSDLGVFHDDGSLRTDSGRILSERLENGVREDVDGQARTKGTERAAGTFVVKDGVEDDRGGYLARNNQVAGKGRDMFGPSALEKMFQPPSPPQDTASTGASVPPGVQTERKTSHAYAPINPSRLSKSVTPSTVSTSMSMSNFPDESGLQDQQLDDQETRIYEEVSDVVLGEESFIGAGPAPEFTFQSPMPDVSAQDEFEAQKPIFDPSLSPFATGEPSHSTMHGRASRDQEAAKPGLRLFRSTYDTYTREHLSALVDSIAIEPSPSPNNGSYSGELMRREDDAESSSPSRSGTGSSHSRSRSSDEYEGRSSKRLRMSPTSPARDAGGVRDWGAQGRAMMDKIRGRTVESNTSVDVSQSFRKENGNLDESGIEYPEPPPTLPLVSLPQYQLGVRRPSQIQHRSNPSTTSSGYLRAAEDLMAKIKARQVSNSTSMPENSPGSVGGRIESASSSDWDLAAIAVQSLKKGKALTSGTGSLRSAGTARSREAVATLNSNPERARLETRRPTSTEPAHHGDGQNDDLNRFVSATTAATATTISTSFVKHPGPRGGGPGGMRMIKPDDVLGLVPDRVGKMRFDRNGMKWIREGLGPVDEAGESKGSRSQSQGSEDVFAGMDSWGHDQPPATQAGVEAVQDNASESSSASEHDDDQAAPRATDPTNIIVDSASDSSESELEQDNPLPFDPPLSPPTSRGSNVMPMISTPKPPAEAPKPIRSALRNVNGDSATPGPLKKAGWHPSVTPAGMSNSPSKRRVSFSDGKKTGRIAGLHSEDDIDVPLDAANPNASGLNGRTNGMRRVLDGMGRIALDNDTPSKIPHGTILASPGTEGSEEADRTAVPLRSFQSRMAANATFLTECSFGVAHDNLIRLITDVYGAEPWWETLTTLDLRSKGVDSVARLKEFLPDLEEVNLEDNKISYLTGVPNGVRTLLVAGNRLTSLTSVNHLQNLHHLDLSRNKLDAVSQLQCLGNLRELNLDKNRISDLGGLLEMGCLLKLSVTDNKLTHLDLNKSKLSKLESLQLSNNELQGIDGLEKLSSLSTLILDGNELSALRPEWAMTNVKTLRISNNRLTRLDLSRFPKVRTVFADRNDLLSIERSDGGTSRIESLSLRNQKSPGLRLRKTDLENVKRLYISGNPISSDFFPTSPLYSLIYLEAAACSLTSWPRDMARRMPNLKILNLNYNYFENLNGLYGMTELRKLTIVGGRLGGSGAKGVVGALRGMTSLEEIDLRMNPSTLGFYLPLILPNPASNAILDPSPRSPPRRQAPLPSVTLATIHPASFRADPPAANVWASLDGQFRKALPDEWYSKRLVYRGLIMATCPKLQFLDGIRVEFAEKRKAEKLLEVIGAVRS